MSPKAPKIVNLEDFDLSDFESLDDAAPVKVEEQTSVEEVQSSTPQDIISMDDINITDLDMEDSDPTPINPIPEKMKDMELNASDIPDALNDVEPSLSEAIIEAKRDPIETINIDEVEVEVEQPVVTPKKEKIKKKKSTLVGEEHIGSHLVPDMDITLIKTDKYQNRQNPHDPVKFNELVDSLKLQGQVEPIHVHKEGEDYQLLAGFGRIKALLTLGVTTVKALVYENLTDDKIGSIVCGTNLGRSELSEWDKCVTVGKYKELHPMVTTDQLCAIFGFGKTKIYTYIDIYSSVYKYEKVREVLSKFNVNTAFLQVLAKNTVEVGKFENDVVEKINNIMNDFDNKINSLKSLEKIFVSKEISDEELDISEEIKELEDDTNLQKDTAAVKKSLDLKPEEKKIITEESAKISGLFDSIIESLNIITEKDPVNHMFRVYQPSLRKKLRVIAKVLMEG